MNCRQRFVRRRIYRKMQIKVVLDKLNKEFVENYDEFMKLAEENCIELTGHKTL